MFNTIEDLVSKANEEGSLSDVIINEEIKLGVTLVEVLSTLTIHQLLKLLVQTIQLVW